MQMVSVIHVYHLFDRQNQTGKLKTFLYGAIFTDSVENLFFIAKLQSRNEF